MAVLFALLLSSLGLAQNSKLDAETPVELATTTGQFKDEFNCLATYSSDEHQDHIVFEGTYRGESGFYVLSPDSLHFYPVYEKLHHSCFTKARPDSTAQNKKGPTMGDLLNNSEPPPDPRVFTHDQFYFEVKHKDEKPFYVTYYRPKKTLHDAHLPPYEELSADDINALSTTNTNLDVEDQKPIGKTTCPLTEHRVDKEGEQKDESKDELETTVVRSVQISRLSFNWITKLRTQQYFEALQAEDQAKRNNKNGESNKTADNDKNKSENKTDKPPASYTLPNPQILLINLSFVQMLRALQLLK